jgi:hypothetical protein
MVRLATLDPAAALRLTKLVHTAFWALFAGSIFTFPVLAWMELWRPAVALILLVLIECIVLALNGMKCPLTAVAARYTTDRRDNFDIYLPLWIARHNKTIFGWLFIVGSSSPACSGGADDRLVEDRTTVGRDGIARCTSCRGEARRQLPASMRSAGRAVSIPPPGSAIEGSVGSRVTSRSGMISPSRFTAPRCCPLRRMIQPAT